MTVDDFSAPLGQQPVKQRRRLPIAVPHVIAGALGLFFALFVVWVIVGDGSFGGEPTVTVPINLQAAKVVTKPFIYLSAGVSNAEFTEALELAGESGVKFNGVLCGRATWKDGIPVYAKHGADAFRKWLETEGVKNIHNVNDKLKAATSWYSIYGVELVHA